MCDYVQVLFLSHLVYWSVGLGHDGGINSHAFQRPLLPAKLRLSESRQDSTAVSHKDS